MASDFHISSIASSLLHSGWEADLTLVGKITIVITIITVISIILVPMLGDYVDYWATQAIQVIWDCLGPIRLIWFFFLLAQECGVPTYPSKFCCFWDTLWTRMVR